MELDFIVALNLPGSNSAGKLNQLAKKLAEIGSVWVCKTPFNLPISFPNFEIWWFHQKLGLNLSKKTSIDLSVSITGPKWKHLTTEWSETEPNGPHLTRKFRLSPKSLLKSSQIKFANLRKASNSSGREPAPEIINMVPNNK